MDEKYVCACGLNCCDCMFYKKEIYETAKRLKELISESRIDTFLSMMSQEEVNSSVARHLNTDHKEFNGNFSVFAQFPQFMEVLQGLINVQCQKTCHEAGGCSMCGETKECAAIICVKEKELRGCWECEEHSSCNKLEFQRASYGKTIDGNFRIIKNQGISAVPSRGHDYYEWQRRIKKEM